MVPMDAMDAMDGMEAVDTMDTMNAVATADPTVNLVDDWWADAIEVDTVNFMPLDGDGGLWNSGFVPPPPRPDFLDDDTMTDGVTTCDLCTWAWHHPVGAESLGEYALLFKALSPVDAHPVA